MNEKLLQGRQLEKEYQARHRAGENSQVEFIEGLKALGIDSIPAYHELVSIDGHKGRTWYVERSDASQIPQLLAKAMANNHDSIFYEVVETTRAYVPSGLEGTPNSPVDEKFCNENGIHIALFPGNKHAFLSSIGDVAMLVFHRKPSEIQSVRDCILGAMVVAYKSYGVDATTVVGKSHNDVMVPVGDELHKAGASDSSDMGDWTVVTGMMNMDVDRGLITRVCLPRATHPEDKVAGSLSEAAGYKVDGQETMEKFVNEFLKLTDGKLGEFNFGNRNLTA